MSISGQAPIGDALLDEKQTATLLNVKPQTLSLWRVKGTSGLPFAKVGRCIRYRRRDIEAWIDANTQGRKAA